MSVTDYGLRLRAVAGGRTILDSTRVKLLHEPRKRALAFVPREDAAGAPEDELSTRDDVPELAGHVSLGWRAADDWFVEDDRVFAHMKDPWHRVDVYESSREVVVRAGDRVIARSTRPKLLFETGLPVRAYLPTADVEPGLLVPAERRALCPYKGESSYWSLELGDETIADAAWSYEAPLAEAARIQGYVCFDLARELAVEVGDPR
jgi:uncharacterized protein (DUF427 family)